MGATIYELPETTGLVKGTNVASGSTIEGQELKGGNFLGYNIYGKEKALVILWDNAKEGKGTQFGPIHIEKETNQAFWFGANGLKFTNAIYCEVKSGKVEGFVVCDIE